MISSVTGSSPRGNARSIGFEAFGVRIAVTAPPGEMFDQLQLALPPARRPCSPELAELGFVVEGSPARARLTKQGELLVEDQTLEVMLSVVEREVRTAVALRAPEVIFVHAGVVAVETVGLVLPGTSFAGKTTLVAELVRSGATYFSDEYAVLDREGRVHPYARRLAIRADGLVRRHHAAESLGGHTGTKPVTVGAIIVTTYRDGASWEPAPMSKGQAVLELLKNTLPAQGRPAESLHAANQAVGSARLLQRGERGDATTVAPLLMNTLRGC